jgi:D-alanyl-D-alanine carboxypeptidase/D-alanyl-D-alanine-endopeptidase (penicillin-binding protein 4)
MRRGQETRRDRASQLADSPITHENTFATMLELLSSGVLSFWLETLGVSISREEAIELLAGPAIPGQVFATIPDPPTERQVQDYLEQLQAKGLLADTQGVWVQSSHQLLVNHRGTIPVPAASITKVATSLAAVLTWGLDHQFKTEISTTGTLEGGVLQGDLILTNGNDPLFVWSSAIAVGNTLNQMGIRRVTGNLVIVDNFSMNFVEADPRASGELLKIALDSSQWTPEAQKAYEKMAPGTAKPQVAIAGNIVTSNAQLSEQTVLLRHHSLPLAELLQQMNIYSNNVMAEMLATALGGPQTVRQLAAEAAGVPREEIQLINGSGLGHENQISPRAAVSMFMAIQRYLQPHEMTLADLFPVSGRDRGTMDYRQIPPGSVVKTGSLWDVSALAGVLPTRDKGWIWFAILNRGDYLMGFRDAQDKLLQQLLQGWQTSLRPPMPPKPWNAGQVNARSLDAATRTEIIYKMGG